MTKPDEPNPNATIQLGAANADDIQLVDNEATDAPESGNPGEAGASRTAPPPLPPEVSLPPPAQPRSVAPLPPPKSARNPLVIGAVFFVLLAVAITVGVKVGASLRAQPAVASAAPPPRTAPSASAVARPATITMPTIEMMDEPLDAGPVH